MPPVEDIWYMVYKDAESRTHTVKGSTRSIRKNLSSGALGNLASIIVSRTKTGQFQPLGAIPEFRDLALRVGVNSQTPLAAPSGTGKRGSAEKVDTPHGGKTPTIPGDGSKSAPSPSSNDVPTETHEVQPLRVKASAKVKVFPPRAVVPSRAEAAESETAERQSIPWWPFAVLGFVLLALISVVVFLLTK